MAPRTLHIPTLKAERVLEEDRYLINQQNLHLTDQLTVSCILALADRIAPVKYLRLEPPAAHRGLLLHIQQIQLAAQLACPPIQLKGPPRNPHMRQCNERKKAQYFFRIQFSKGFR
jgi:hypothetical protein